MKKIIINSNIIWTIANFRIDVIKALQKEGFEIICIASKDNFSKNSEKILKSIGCKIINIKLDRKGLNPFLDLIYFIKLYFLYKKILPNLIIHYTIKPNIYGSFAAKLNGLKSINIVTGLGSGIIKGGILSKIIIWLYKKAFKYSSAILFENKDDKNYFITKKITKFSNSYYVPGAGLDTDFFDNCKKNKNDSLSFLMIARLLKDKGIYEYIDACKKIKKKYKNIKCLLAGVFDNDNPSSITKKELDTWIKDNIIKYLGQTDNIKDFFKKGDVVVLPSYREGLSRVLLEAASCKKPLVTTNVPGCKEVVIENKNGFLCKAKDSQSLFKAMEKVIQNQDNLEKMGNFSRKHIIKNFSKEIVNEIYLDVIKKVLN